MKIIHQPSRDLWEKVAQQSQDATFFHTPSWVDIISNTFPEFQPETKAFKLRDGSFAILSAVASVERNRYFKWYESSHLGGYGGLISERALELSEVNQIFKKALNRHVANFHMIGNPLANQIIPTGFSKTHIYTHILKLNPDYQQILKSFKRGRRFGIKKAAKLGIEAKIATTEQEFQSYFEVYEDTLKRWGDKTLVTYPYKLFQNIFLQNDSKIKLWLARLDSEVISGAITFEHNRIVNCWHAATKNDYLNTRVDPFLTAHTIEDACNRGFKYYDLGASGGLEGLENYKEQYGATKWDFNSYTWQNNFIYNTYQRFSHQN